MFARFVVLLCGGGAAKDITEQGCVIGQPIPSEDFSGEEDSSEEDKEPCVPRCESAEVNKQEDEWHIGQDSQVNSWCRVTNSFQPLVNR